MGEIALLSASEFEAINDPAQRIVLLCEHAKTLLAHALDSGQIKQIVELKSQAEAIRVYTMQKQLGKDAALSATEIVRRAERCIGLAIRKGQAEGRIAKRGQGGGGGKPPGAKRDRSDSGMSLPTHFVSSGELSGNEAGIYAMTDGVTDQQFEKAITETKAERNLSRTNVVRKLKGNGKVDRWANLAELAADGHTSSQIAKKLGVTRDTVTKKAADLDVVIHADRVVGRSRLPNSVRILKSFMATLESLIPSCVFIEPQNINRAVLEESVGVLDEALPALRRLRTRLHKEIKL